MLMAKIKHFVGVYRTYLIVLFVFVGGFLMLPVVHFDSLYSSVLYDSNGQLLGALVSADGQWRFEKRDSIPEKFKTSILQFEDQYYFYHPGVNPMSILRALWQNARAGEIQSGGSTITMQVVRMSSKPVGRTYIRKLWEFLLAIRLEVALTKDEILQQYVAYAPFGGNVVGLEAASWRYFGRDAFSLSWAECAMLAVLPNAPSIIHPGKNRKLLLEKRNRLLLKLYLANKISKETYDLSLLEEIPQKPLDLPQLAPHLLQKSKVEYPSQSILSTVSRTVQKRCNAIVKQHYERLKDRYIMNIAVMVTEVKSGNILAYVGNVPFLEKEYASDVDLIQAPRSSGSTLKPFLLAALLNEGAITPYSLIPDVPSYYSGFVPRNFSLSFDGAVSANEALVRSLNIPAVYMLREYGYAPFHQLLKQCGFKHMNKPSDHYGLSLILGGAEVSLYELCGAYGALGSSLLSETNEPALMPSYVIKDKNRQYLTIPLSKASIFTTFQYLTQLTRPDEESGWQFYQSSSQVAWKTGTSFGFRDAWAVGVTPDLTVGVWVGNADGVGRAGLTGVKVAAPILFDVLNSFNSSDKWFLRPSVGYSEIEICRESGFRASMICDHKEWKLVPEKCAYSEVCPYHKQIHLDSLEHFQVSSECYPVHAMVQKAWFSLPPTMEYYYRKKHPEYKVLPSFGEGCYGGEQSSLSFILPANNFLFLPKTFGGEKGVVVFEVAQSGLNCELYWHLDGEFIGSTLMPHQMALSPNVGQHSITVVDGKGISVQKSFKIVESE